MKKVNLLAELTEATDRIEELEQEVERLTDENRRLFDAHSVEMVRADKLQQKLEGDGK